VTGAGRARTIDGTLSVRDGHLWLDGIDTVALARDHGTPVYVLSERRLRANAAAYRAAFGDAWPHGEVRILPSLKANPSTAVARILASEGVGCDVFGPSEFRLAMSGGFPPELVSLNGSIKDQTLIDEAVAAGARITLDSAAELDRVLDATARTGRRAGIRLRARPDYAGLDLPTDFVEEPVPMSEAARRYKAGIPTDELLETGRRALAAPAIDLRGLMVHLPRHRTEVAVWASAAERFADVAAAASDAWAGWRPAELDLGGGLPSPRDPTGGLVARRADEPREPVPGTAAYATAIADALGGRLRDGGIDPAGIVLEVEPGRALFADAGIHLATVRHVKREHAPTPWTWVETDTSEVFLLDVLIEHNLWRVVAADRMDEPTDLVADVVGRSCGFDLIVPDAALPSVREGDLLAFLDTGAYQDASATNFNAMPRPATILVDGDRAEVIKRAESVDDVFARDVVPERLGGR
jgi:diaminopimelate decarboxylase